MYEIKVNIAGLWSTYDFEDKDDAAQFLAYVGAAVKKSADDPLACFTAGDDDEMSTIFGRHIVGYKVSRPEWES